MAKIFQRNLLPTRGQLNAVAERRFRDAESLLATGDNERAAGAMYLAGYTIEVLLKGRVLGRFPDAGRPPRPGEDDSIRRARDLIFRSHDLEAMLDAVPRLDDAVQLAGERAGRPYLRYLRQVCGQWTPFARYSPRSATIREARNFTERIRPLKEILK
jgi:hypothetical protein